MHMRVDVQFLLHLERSRENDGRRPDLGGKYD